MQCYTKCTTQLNAIAVLRVKFNATPRNAPHQIWHTDWKLIYTKQNLCNIFEYNDGYTEFREDVENIF